MCGYQFFVVTATVFRKSLIRERFIRYKKINKFMIFYMFYKIIFALYCISWSKGIFPYVDFLCLSLRCNITDSYLFSSMIKKLQEAVIKTIDNECMSLHERVGGLFVGILIFKYISSSGDDNYFLRTAEYGLC